MLYERACEGSVRAVLLVANMLARQSRCRYAMINGEARSPVRILLGKVGLRRAQVLNGGCIKMRGTFCSESDAEKFVITEAVCLFLSGEERSYAGAIQRSSSALGIA